MVVFEGGIIADKYDYMVLIVYFRSLYLVCCYGLVYCSLPVGLKIFFQLVEMDRQIKTCLAEF